MKAHPESPTYMILDPGDELIEGDITEAKSWGRWGTGGSHWNAISPALVGRVYDTRVHPPIVMRRTAVEEKRQEQIRRGYCGES